MSYTKKILPLIFLFSLFSFKITGQSYDIDYYGIVSTEIDSNMAKMTSDLYYTQLTEINNFSVSDKRTENSLQVSPDPQTFSSNKLSFFTTITKDNLQDLWITTYHVVDKANNEEHTKQKQYASFYKILMESKNELKETIKQLIENDTNSKSLSLSSHQTTHSSSSQTSTENLSGTWSGENNIDKIVILRGGRGFVIFKNGASMNVTVQFSDNSDSQIIITQNGRSNASFYPELPRNVALNAALSAEPIQWVLTMTNETTLSGTKNTLLPDGDNYVSGSLEVQWNKIN